MKSAWLFLLLLPGCYYLGQNTYTDITITPSSEWSGPELYTVIMEAGNHNLRDFRTNIKAIATPYYPSVIKAIGRRAQIQYHWPESEFQSYVDKLLHEGSAMFVNWEKPGEPVYDSKLHLLDSVTQFDSLMVLLTLKNTGYPPGKYIVMPTGMGFRNIPIDDIHYIPPDITHLESQIYLVNERGDSLSPMILWGRNMNYLTNIDETIFLKFKLREGEKHFLEDSKIYCLVIRGLEENIRLELSANLMK
jgi:hypothetical protein